MPGPADQCSLQRTQHALSEWFRSGGRVITVKKPTALRTRKSSRHPGPGKLVRCGSRSSRSTQVVGCRRGTPDTRCTLAVPRFWSLRRVVMPGTGIEIAELLVLHLVKLNVELNIVAVAIAMIDGDVMPRAMTHRAPVDRHLAQREELARILDVGKVLHLEGDVV